MEGLASTSLYGGAIWLKDLLLKEILSGVPKGLHHSDHDNNTWNERRITKAIQRDRVWVLPGSSCLASVSAQAILPRVGPSTRRLTPEPT